MEKPFGIIYKATNTINGKCYIGQTVRGLICRKNGHKKDSDGFSYSSYFHNAIRKYGFSVFDWEILSECSSRKELNEQEMYYINKFESSSSEKGYNLTLGGGGSNGRIMTEKTRKKISDANKGKIVLEETREKLKSMFTGVGNPFYGKKHTDETKERMCKNSIGKNLGHVVTDETRDKIRKKITGKIRSDETKEKIRIGHRKYSLDVMIETMELKTEGMKYKTISNKYNIPVPTLKYWHNTPDIYFMLKSQGME